jgi:hypothetical protein
MIGFGKGATASHALANLAPSSTLGGNIGARYYREIRNYLNSVHLILHRVRFGVPVDWIRVDDIRPR